MSDDARLSQSRHGETGWAVAIPGMFAWVKVMPAGRGFYATEQEAKDALIQMGPRNGEVVMGGTRYG